MSTFRKIGAALGGALMLGSTLAGAALAAGDVSKFYTEYAVKDGSSDDTMFVIGSGGSSPSGIAMDVVSAIGIAAQVGQKAMTETAGAGTVTLAVETTTVDGRELKSELTDNLNAELSSSGNNLVLRSKDKAATNSLSTLGSGTLTMASTDYKWEEKLTISNLNTAYLGYAAGDTVSTSDAQAGYDSPVAIITGGNNWVEYEMSYETAPTIATMITNAAGVRFLGKDYTLMSGSSLANGIKLAEAGKEQTLSAGQTIEAEGLKIKLVLVQTGSTSTAESTAVLEVTPTGGSAVSSSIRSGESATVGGVNIYVKSAGQAYAANQQTSSATLIIGGDILTLEHNKYLKWDGANTRWMIELSPTTGTTLTSIKVNIDDSFDGVSALDPADEIAMPSDLVKLTFNGFDSQISTSDLTLEATTIDLDNSGGADDVVVARLPAKNFKIGTNYYDTVYSVAVAQAAKGTGGMNFATVGLTAFLNTTSNYEDSALTVTGGTGSAGIQIDLGDKQYLYNTTTDLKSLVRIDEPQSKYSTDTGQFEIQVCANCDSGTTPKFRNASSNGQGWFMRHDISLRSGLTSGTDSIDELSNKDIGWRDSNSVVKYLTNLVTPWGTVVKSAGESSIVLTLSPAQRFIRMTVGGQSTTEETSTATVGSEVTIGGAKINVKDAGATGASAAGIPLPIAKVDSEVSATDKASKNFVLVGGPVVNSLTAELATELAAIDAEISNDAPGAEQGRVAVVEDAFATGKVAVVVAGSDRYGTQAAAQALQLLDTFADSVAGEAVATFKYSAAGSAPTVV